MQNEKYYVGLDIGTDSVGYAVSKENYELCKFKGEPMWGVTLFDEANNAAGRRGFRTERRRLNRRRQRVKLIADLFAREIAKVDESFFKRIKESYYYPETRDDKVRLFGSYEQQKAYVEKYPTIHHLIDELMKSDEVHDVRLVYLACSWLVAHRGHFLNEVSEDNVEAVTDFKNVYTELVDFIKRDGKGLPWSESVDPDDIANALKGKRGINEKKKQLTAALFGKGKAPKLVDEEHEYNYELVLKLMCGGKVALKDLYGNAEYAELEKNSVSLDMSDEDLASIMQSIGDDADLMIVLKKVYDWSVLDDILNGKNSISEAKCEAYDRHKNDLKTLKYFVKAYLPEEYDRVFRSEETANNYVAYIGKSKPANKSGKTKKTANKDDFCKYILTLFKNVTPEAADAEEFKRMKERLEDRSFMPKQVDGDNRVIPYQLYRVELKAILEKAEKYIPFLSEVDEDGISGKDKVLSVFSFRVPYYVGPLKEKDDRKSKYNHWMVRRAEGRIYPWNFEQKVDLDASEDAFINKMTNSCTYLPLPEVDVLPKNSLLYCSYSVLNEINNIKINGNDISVKAKQELYENIFMHYRRVSRKNIENYLVSNNHMNKDDVLSGIDVSVKSSLASYIDFGRLMSSGLLDESKVESIIRRAAYSEDKARFSKWLRTEFPDLPEKEIKYITGLKLKGFGRLSKRLLCDVEGVNSEKDKYPSIIRAMWETNNNLMQLLSSKFTFAKNIENIVQEYYGKNPRSINDRLDEMYVSNSVKRPIIRSLDIMKDIVKVQGQPPERIFIEMARGTKEDLKGKRTKSRLEQLRKLYEKVDSEDVRIMNEQLEQLDALGESVDSKLQSDKLFLYFVQLGKCLYTGETININSVLSGDGTYNIEHIYPRSFVKDDSVLNNEILVNSKVNGSKDDNYPVDQSIRNKMRPTWEYYHKIGLIGDEKFKRLTRATEFTDAEKFEFINRQLVETRQSTKALATLLKDLYPHTDIVYVKAGLVSDYRQKFELPKSRSVNDLHHAKDAYLNIVAGNVWYCKYSKDFWRKDQKNNAKVEAVFTQQVKCKGELVWNGASDIGRVARIVGKNTAHMTKYAFCRKRGINGGLFDQMPVSAKEGLVPIKKGRPTEIYGGYNSVTITFFVLVKYRIGKKQDVMVMPVELLYADKFLKDESFALEYAKETVSKIVGKPVESLEFVLNKRILKVNTVLSLDGFRMCLRGKSGDRLVVSAFTTFKTSAENEAYIKHLESFDNKRKKNENIIFSEKYDKISPEQNIALYDHYIEKLKGRPYSLRPTNPCDAIVGGREKFISLTPDKQISVLLAIQGLFGRAKSANLTEIGGGASAGEAKIYSYVSKWKRNYKDVRIVDQSASGLFETVSENLLELL